MNLYLKKIAFNTKKAALKIGKCFFLFLGIFAFILIVLSFTDLPYYAYHNLGMVDTKLTTKPDLIVILGGGGMPSQDGLIRTYYASEVAIKYNSAQIIIALPYTKQKDNLSQLHLMANELIIRGIDSLRITYEPLGHNTWSQAVNIAQKYADKKAQISLIVVTTPEHMYRSIKTFKKAGFKNIGGLPTFEKPSDSDKLKSKLKSKEASLSFRYNMWSYLNYELLVLREYCAIGYYKLKGWI